MSEVSLTHSYPELFRVTGPLLSLVLRTEDVWQRYKPDSSKRFGALNPGFPFSPLQCRQGRVTARRFSGSDDVRDKSRLTAVYQEWSRVFNSTRERERKRERERESWGGREC